MPGSIRVERDGPVATILFDHPERRNAITSAMWREIPVVARELDRDDRVRVVILRGAGEIAFVSGADISEFAEQRRGPEAQRYEAQNWAAFDAIEAIRKPVLAAIHGFCIGGGCALSLTADLRYCADDAVFAIPAARLGLGYNPRGLHTLMRIVGESAAKEIFMTARRFDAQEARALGLVNRVIPKDELDATVARTAETLAGNAPLTLQAAKLALSDAVRPEAERNPEAVEEAVRACFESEDYVEGVEAFLGKRRPEFRGR